MRIDRTQPATSPVLTVPVNLVLSLLLGATVATVFLDGEAAAIVTAAAVLVGLSAGSWLFISARKHLLPRNTEPGACSVSVSAPGPSVSRCTHPFS